jgi:hypothetical protein
VNQFEEGMDIAEEISQQRVKHIISSYQLDGNEGNSFDLRLEKLLETYPAPLIELAAVETLVEHWLTVPMVRGVAFLAQVLVKLQTWELDTVVSTITPDQFQQITGLDPSPVFGISEIALKQSPVKP